MKKILAAILVLAMILTMSTTVFAGLASDTGDAVVEFQFTPGVTDAHDGVYCITNLPVLPPNSQWPPALFTAGIDPLGFDFGVRPRGQVAQAFSTLDTTTVGVIGAPALTPNRSGVVILSSLGGWSVGVQINTFMSTTGANTGNPTMTGFELTFVPHNGPLPGPGTGPSFVRSPTTPNPALGLPAAPGFLTIEAGNPQAQVASSNGFGLFATNFEGRIAIPAGQAHDGQAQAVMTWTFTPGTIIP